MLSQNAQAESITQIKPGVYRIPLKKHVAKPELVSSHPKLGDWEHAEMWDQKVKEPVNNLSNFMYAMDCIIGTPSTGETE